MPDVYTQLPPRTITIRLIICKGAPRPDKATGPKSAFGGNKKCFKMEISGFFFSFFGQNRSETVRIGLKSARQFRVATDGPFTTDEPGWARI
jgi:hypothetical protein